MATKLNEVTAADMRAAMIDSQLRTNDVIDPAVVAAMGSVAREAHVPAALASVAYGYTAALLAALGASVVAVEEQADLLAAARAATDNPAIRWVEGPLAAGAPGEAPVDRIMIDGAIEQLPDALAAQLAEGGKLVAARREGSVTRLVQGIKTADTLALRAFADMDVAALPGFEAPKGFRF